ncbi:MAG TPA: tetrahydrofolate dehydrogenase/cyclohydrolase catalytic domain-containing protein [Anaerolineales bacterium]|nr:tetrahydrofolate dehydrogenase/cyclohydrolase catalytic domain-containing protein [Anaerolineales bacterium]
MAILMDGLKSSKNLREKIAHGVAEIVAERGIVPSLATVLVGDNPASRTYVGSKHKACEEAGMQSPGYVLPASTSQADLLALIAQLNNDPAVHGILVQLPLPAHIQSEAIINAINPAKDVDGFHPQNVGRLAIQSAEHYSVPCTPAGVMHLLDEYGATYAGKNAVVVGRSKIVGLPVSLLLLARNATVTICHSKTADLAGVCRQADILVAAVGRAKMIKGDWVKPGAYVVDVGINEPWLENPHDEEYTCVKSGENFVGHHADQSEKRSRRLVGYVQGATNIAYAKNHAPADLDLQPDYAKIFRKYEIVGDVDFASAEKQAGYITPVPGGVGPMTIAKLLENTLFAAKAS